MRFKYGPTYSQKLKHISGIWIYKCMMPDVPKAEYMLALLSNIEHFNTPEEL